MVAESNAPDVVRISDVKRLDSSLTLKRNRPQLEAVLAELQKVVRNEELQTGLVVQLPLDKDKRVHELTVSHYTRDGVPQSEQDETLYWSDYAAILLDLAQKFKKTAVRDDFMVYGPTAIQLEEWASAPNTPVDVIDELTTWENRYKLAELAQKLAGAFATKVEPDEDESPEPKSDEKTADLTDEQVATIAAALTKDDEQDSAVVPEAAGSDTDTVDTDTTPSTPQLQPGEEIDRRRPLNQQLSSDQMRQYNSSVGWMTSFTLLQIADSMGVEIADLDPALRGTLTTAAVDFLQREGDIAALLAGSPTARLKAIRGLNRFLREQNFYQKNQLKLPGEIHSTNQIIENKLHDILNDTNPVIDKIIEKNIEDIVLVHGEKAIGIIASFDKPKVEIIFGLQAYALTDAQISALKNTLISYAEVRLAEIVLHTQNEEVKKGLVGDQDLSTKDTLELAGAVRSAITTHSSQNNDDAELLADAITTNKKSTGERVQHALEQNEKIFGNTWRSLRPEEQADALRFLGLQYTIAKDGKHPVGGYPLPINIAELDTGLLKKYRDLIITEKRLIAEAQLEELQMAVEMNEHMVAMQRAEMLSLHARNEYIIRTNDQLVAALHQQEALDQQSLQQMLLSEQSMALEGGGDQELTGSTVASATGALSRFKDSMGALSKNKLASNVKSEAAKKMAGKIGEKLAMGTGIGTAAVAAKKFLDKTIGEENSKKLLQILGGLSAGVAGALIAKTIQALQTIGGALGGAIGGVVGGIVGVGSPLAIFVGVSAGANAGLAAQNWILNLFGKGPSAASGTSLGSTAFSTPSWGSGTSAATASTTTSTTPTVVRGADAVIQGTGNTIQSGIQAVNNVGQQVLVTAPEAAAAGVKAAAVATGSFLTSLPAIAVGGSLILPGFMTIIVFTVIMGAFLVPMPFTIEKGTPTVSQYATVTKTATPEEIENNTEEDIEYEIFILPKPGYSLVIKRVTDEFLVLGGNATVPDSPLTIDAFSQERFTTRQEASYTSTISGEDALVINTVTFVVDVYDRSGKIIIQGESISTVGLVFVGNPPIGCFNFASAGTSFTYEDYTVQSAEWTPTEINQLLAAFVKRAGRNPTLTSLLCADGDITLVRLHENRTNYVGYVNEGKMALWDTAFNSIDLLEYVFIHELGHILDFRNPGLRNSFLQAKTEPGCFSYPYGCNDAEAFAEGTALYVIHQTYVFSSKWTGLYPFSTNNPNEYTWFKENVYGNIEY